MSMRLMEEDSDKDITVKLNDKTKIRWGTKKWEYQSGSRRREK